MIALAVWACQATASGPIHIGGQPAIATGIPDAVHLATEILRDGTVHLGEGIDTAIAHLIRDLQADRLHWPALAVEELAEQLTAYRHRHSRYQPERLTELLAEIWARHRAVTNNAASGPSRILGTDETAETPLRHIHLTGIGTRITGTVEERVADVYLAEPTTGSVLVLRHRYLTPANTEPPTGADLAGRRIGPSTLRQLAAGHVVTESAIRTANRRLRLSSARLGKTTVTPSSGAWDTFGPNIMVSDFAALTAELDALPPHLIRPRVDAASMRILRIDAVHDITWAPGDQRLTAIITDTANMTITVEATHRAECPDALDVLAEAMSASPRYLSGTVRRARSGVLIDPVAVVVADRVITPDLVHSDRTTTLPWATHSDPEPISATIAVLAEAAHRGLRHLPPTYPDRLIDAAATLNRHGYRRAATAVHTFATTLKTSTGPPAAEAWSNAAIRLLVTAERR